MGLLFLSCLISLPLGMGLSKLIMATLLEKSNIVGNSLTDTEKISSPITLIDRSDENTLIDWGTAIPDTFEKLKQTPAYQESIKNKLDVDDDFCAQGIEIKDGAAVITKQIISPIEDYNFAPITAPTQEHSGSVSIPAPDTPKRSWKEAVDDFFMDMDEKDS